jgi:hypothetical protein
LEVVNGLKRLQMEKKIGKQKDIEELTSYLFEIVDEGDRIAFLKTGIRLLDKFSLSDTKEIMRHTYKSLKG